MLAVDIQAFNDHQRGEDAQRFLRAGMYAILTQAFGRSGVEWPACHCEDRGDGVLVILPPGAPATALIDPLAEYLRAGLRGYNKFCNDLARISLRVSVHAGQVYFDGHGVSGRAVTHLFRMLDAQEVRRVLAESGSDFALVSSETLYDEVISQGFGLIDPEMYAPVDIECKETYGRGWLYLPPVRNPCLRRPGSRGRERRTAAGANAGEGDSRRSARPRPGSVTRLPPPLPDWRARRPHDPAAAGDTAADGSSAPVSMPTCARSVVTNAVARPRRLAAVPGMPLQTLLGRLHVAEEVQHA